MLFSLTSVNLPRVRLLYDGRERGLNLAQLVGDDAAEDLAPALAQVRVVHLDAALAVGLHLPQLVALRAPHRVYERDAQGVQVDDGHALLLRDALDGVGVGEQVRVNLIVLAEAAARQGRYQNGLRARGARLVHVARDVRGVGRAGVCLALRPLARHVVVAELNQYVVAFERQSLLPPALGGVGLRAAPVLRHVDDFDFGRDEALEARPPTVRLAHGRVADEHYPDPASAVGGQGFDGLAVDAHVLQDHPRDVADDARLGHVLEGAVLQAQVVDGRVGEALHVERVAALAAL